MRGARRPRMQNFPELFAAAAARHPTRPAIEVQRRDGLEQVRYDELHSWSERVAAWLALIGVEPQDRCAILADNDAHWCAAYLGVLRRGAVAVPLDTAYSAAQIETLVRDSGARVCFTSAKYLPAVRAASLAAVSDMRVVLLHGGAAGEIDLDAMIRGRMPAPPLPACPAGPESPAVILYTSGTTSDPKGVVLTHENLLAERDGAFGVVRVSEDDAVLGVLPLFHALAQMANLLLPLSVGARVVFLETVNTTELLSALSSRGITVFACVPQFFYLIHQRVRTQVDRGGALARALFSALLAVNGALRSARLNAGPLLFRRVHRVLGGRMRLLVTGGSRFDPAVGRDLYRMGFDILQAYGLTETSGAATLMRPGDSRLESVGLPLPGVEIRIDTTAGDPEAGDGEVLIRGPIVMQGYFNRPDATAAALDNGWLRTGDLGRLDADGRLTITGRMKEVIVLSSGKNIYPEEIEAAYLKSPFIKEVCLVGLAGHGPSAERLHAVVVPNHELMRQRKVANIGDLLRFEIEGAAVALPAHKRALGYEIWMDPLPRTTTGKLKRFEIARRVQEASAARDRGPATLTATDRAWLEEDAVAPIVEAIAGAVPGVQVGPASNLELDLGLDSMERVELLTLLEQQFAADIPGEEVQQLHTVREVVEAILRHGRPEPSEPQAGAWDALLAPDALDQAGLEQWLRPRVIVPTLLFVVLRAAIALLRPGLRIEATGLESLPARGPYLISPNHQSYLDPFVLVGCLPLRVVRQLFFVGASEYFETPLRRWFAQQINLVPVDPDAGLIPAMQAGAHGLRRGRVLILFPEGERSIDGTVRRFKKGAAILAHHLQVPIVPVGIDGVFAIWPRNRRLNWRALLPGSGTRVAIAAGAPILPDRPRMGENAGKGEGEAGRAGTAEAYRELTARLRSAVEGLWSTARKTASGLRS